MELRDLLREWGQCLNTEALSPTGLGYPSGSLGMDTGQPTRRTDAEQKEVDRLARIARKSTKRKLTTHGRVHKIREMIPRAQPHDTRARFPYSPRYEPWPADIQRVHDAVLYVLSEAESEAIIRRYAIGDGRRQAAQDMGITEREYRTVLERAEDRIREIMGRDSVA